MWLQICTGGVLTTNEQSRGVGASTEWEGWLAKKAGEQNKLQDQINPVSRQQTNC